MSHGYSFFLIMRAFNTTLLATFKMQYSIVNYSYHAVYYIPRHYLIIVSLHLLTAFTHFTSPPALGKHQSVLCIYAQFVFLDTTYERNNTVFVFLWLTYFTSKNALRVQPCCHKRQDFLLSYGRIIFVYLYIYVYIYMNIQP